MAQRLGASYLQPNLATHAWEEDTRDVTAGDARRWLLLPRVKLTLAALTGILGVVELGLGRLSGLFLVALAGSLAWEVHSRRRSASDGSAAGRTGSSDQG
jgi:hypothetical protein